MSAKDRFMRRVVKSDGDGCWMWTGFIDPGGYGRFGIYSGNSSMAHRFSYELHVGPIPAGLQLDHLCRNRACCNPSHLEPVTRRENILRGIGPTARNAVKTHCPHGHAYSPENTYIRPNGKRVCIACRRIADNKEGPKERRKQYKRWLRANARPDPDPEWKLHEEVQEKAA